MIVIGGIMRVMQVTLSTLLGILTSFATKCKGDCIRGFLHLKQMRKGAFKGNSSDLLHDEVID